MGAAPQPAETYWSAFDGAPSTFGDVSPGHHHGGPHHGGFFDGGGGHGGGHGGH